MTEMKKYLTLKEILDTRGKQGWSLLYSAARHNHLKLIQYLIAEQQMDPLCRNNSGATALHKACHAG